MAENEIGTKIGGFSLLRSRNFVFLWLAYAISAVGDHLSEMALLKTQNALSADVDITPLTARMTFMFFVPFFVLATGAGWMADKLPRRAVMVTADILRCVVLFSFAKLIGWTQGWGTWGPFVPLLIVGIFAAMFSPARQALLPTLIRSDQLVRANGLISGLGIIATMISVALSGYLADRYVPTFAFRIDAVTFLMSAVFLLLINPPQRHVEDSKKKEKNSPLKELADGFRYIRSHRHLKELLIIASLVWFCAPLVNSVIPAIVRDVYGGSYATISSYRVYLGAGFVFGAIVISVMGDALRSEIAITWGLLGISISILIFAFSVFLPFDPVVLSSIGAVGVALAGMFAVAVMASFDSLMQRTTADRYRGRVFGVKDLCTTAALLLATGMLGVPQWTRVDRWVGWILIAVALITFVAGVWTMKVRLQRGPHGPKLNYLENLNEFISKFWWGMKRIGPSTVPRTGAVIVTSNHRNAADPLLLLAGMRYRILSFMIAAEYANWPIVHYMVTAAECIPVRRGTSEIGPTRQAMRYLQGGGGMGIFIEGGIVEPGQTPKPKDGVAMLALRTGAKVIPAYISGLTYRKGVVHDLLTRHRACVRYGPEVDLSEFQHAPKNRDIIRAATRKIHEAIYALAPDGETLPAETFSVEQDNPDTESST